MKQHDSHIHAPEAEGQGEMTEIMISVDRGDNRQKEMKIINAYCAQYRGSVSDFRQSRMFSMAVCSVPKAEVKEFKMKLQSHLDAFRDNAEQSE